MLLPITLKIDVVDVFMRPTHHDRLCNFNTHALFERDIHTERFLSAADGDSHVRLYSNIFKDQSLNHFKWALYLQFRKPIQSSQEFQIYRLNRLKFLKTVKEFQWQVKQHRIGHSMNNKISYVV